MEVDCWLFSRVTQEDEAGNSKMTTKTTKITGTKHCIMFVLGFFVLFLFLLKQKSTEKTASAQNGGKKGDDYQKH